MEEGGAEKFIQLFSPHGDCYSSRGSEPYSLKKFQNMNITVSTALPRRGEYGRKNVNLGKTKAYDWTRFSRTIAKTEFKMDKTPDL